MLYKLTGKVFQTRYSKPAAKRDTPRSLAKAPSWMGYGRPAQSSAAQP